MRLALVFCAVVLFTLLGSVARACDYNANVAVRVVAVNYVQPVVATVEVPAVASQVAVVPLVASYNFAAVPVVIQKNVIVRNVEVRNVRARNRNAGSGVVGILGAAARTVGNVAGAVVGGR